MRRQQAQCQNDPEGRCQKGRNPDGPGFQQFYSQVQNTLAAQLGAEVAGEIIFRNVQSQDSTDHRCPLGELSCDVFGQHRRLAGGEVEQVDAKQVDQLLNDLIRTVEVPRLKTNG